MYVQILGRGGDPLMSDGGVVRDTADAVKGIVEAVPIYEDMIQPAAKEMGVALHTVTKAINLVLKPISGLIWGYEKIESYLMESLSNKFKDVPEDRLVTPILNIAGPAIEALRFSGHIPELRELYANLIATSMDRLTTSEAHPAFVEIINQLTPDEARIVKILDQPLPVINLIAQRPGHIYTSVLERFSLIGEKAGCELLDLVPSYLNNIVRLGLADLTFLKMLSDIMVYKELENQTSFLDAVAEIEKANYIKQITCGGLFVTPFGKMFCTACVYHR